MREEGTVIETYGDFAKVEAKRSLSCEGCASKDMCKPGSDSMIIEALNPVGAVSGDGVAFEIGKGAFLKSSFILYLMPVIFIVIGAWLGGEAASYFLSVNKEAISALSAAVFFFLSIIALLFINKYFFKNAEYKPVIKEIL